MSPTRRRWLIGGAAAAALVVLIVLAAARIPFSSAVLRDRVVATLADRLDAVVELERLSLRALPTLHAEGTGLTIRHRGRTDVPPLISVEKFIVDAHLIDVWRKRVSHVRLDGLEIQIPPDDTGRDDQAIAITGEHVIAGDQVIVEDLVADAARLVIIPRDPEKQHRTWVMHTLRAQNVSVNTRMPFQTTLTNAVPPGEIVTEGTFGPWHRDDPGHTPIDGTFEFRDADLSVFKGISGTLGARGSYGGRIETIEVKGRTSIPDFTLEVSGQPVPLEAEYHAVIDGTNGDTRLEQVNATFLRTSVRASGGIYDVGGRRPEPAAPKPEGRRREVVLAAAIDGGRLEDVMRLAVKASRPPMSGALTLQTKIVIPPGDEDVVDKLELAGQFAIEDGRFADPGVQQKINDMSRRASGRIAQGRTQPDAPRVASDFQGRFNLAGGVLRLPTLVFDIPGAAVKLNGHYALRRETISFAGNLYMDAKVSQTVTGWKSLLLKVADPLFRENGQTVVPIRISGTREAPAFGMDVKRVFSR